MKGAFLIVALAGLIVTVAGIARADHYLNQTKEERPRKKKKVKGFDYEASRYFNKATDVGGHYVYTEDGAPIDENAGKKKKKGKKSEDGDADAASSDAGSTASLGETRPKPAFKRVDSFSSQNKSKTGQGALPGGMTPEQAIKAGQAAQAQAQGGQGGGWNNFQTGANAGYGQGQPGQVKVMP